MMHRIVNKLTKILLRESANLRLWSLKRLYPGLSLDQSVQIRRNGGEFIYGNNVNILEQTIIELPKDACVRLGSNVIVSRSCVLHPSSQQEITIGQFARIHERSLLTGNVKVGRYSMIAANFYASSGTHFVDIVPEMTIQDQDELVFSDSQYESLRDFHKPVEIEEDCWIGINVAIMSGVNIGKGSIIGSNSVVTKDIPPYSIAVGAPAKVIKQRLVFAPPSVLDWTELHHRPYFYAGFCIDNATMQQYSSGIAGYGECVISLSKSEKPTFLCIEAIPLLPEISMVFGGIHLPMMDGATTYRYNIPENANSTFFSLKIHRNPLPIRAEEPAFLLKKAWLE
jgi:acetyltransferase-like isoleucine patch superfamily enzyme